MQRILEGFNYKWLPRYGGPGTSWTGKIIDQIEEIREKQLTRIMLKVYAKAFRNETFEFKWWSETKIQGKNE